MIGCLIDAGVHRGLDRGLSSDIVRSMVYGAAHHIRITNEHPKLFAEKVTSPGGVTSRALSILDKTGFDYCLHQAVAAAASHQPYVSSQTRRMSTLDKVKEPPCGDAIRVHTLGDEVSVACVNKKAMY